MADDPSNNNMPMKLRFEAVIFDMDGLMFDTERLGLEGYHHAARLYGYEPDSDAFHFIIGRTVTDAIKLLRNRFGSDFPVEKIREARRQHIAGIIDNSGVPTKSGLMELLAHLKKSNIPLAIASSSSRASVEKNLRNTGILDNFQVIVCGDEVTHGKPDPEIYLKAAEKLSKEPSTCVVLEDALLGVQAAYAAGMIPIMVPDMQQPTETIRRMAHKILPSLLDVRAYFESESQL